MDMVLYWAVSHAISGELGLQSLICFHSNLPHWHWEFFVHVTTIMYMYTNKDASYTPLLSEQEWFMHIINATASSLTLPVSKMYGCRHYNFIKHLLQYHSCNPLTYHKTDTLVCLTFTSQHILTYVVLEGGKPTKSAKISLYSFPCQALATLLLVPISWLQLQWRRIWPQNAW